MKKRKKITISTLLGLIGLFGIVYIVSRQQSTDIRDKAADDFDPSTCNYTVLTDGDLATANLLADDGDVVCIMPGTYTTPINPTNNGSSEAYIFYKGVENIDDDVIVTEGCNFDGKEYIRIESVYFLSERYYWFSIDSASSYIHIEDCTFNSTAGLGTDPSSWVGLRIHGSYVTVRECTFYSWLTGDIVSILAPGNHALIEYNDFSQSIAEHGQVTVNGDYSVVRHNYFRNPCDRSLAITYNVSHGTVVGGNLIENNIIVDTNKDDEDDSNGCEGADQAIKLCINNSIFRNNLIIGSNEGKEYELQGALHLQTYTDVYTYENLRVYHNTMYSNYNTGIKMSINSDTYDIGNNAFKNNVITQSEGYEIYFQDRYTYNNSDGSNRGWLFDTNIIASSDDATNKSIYIKDDPSGNREHTAEEANTMHEEFIGNIGVLPNCNNTNILDQIKANPEKYSLGDFGTIFDAFSLKEGSEGENAATYLSVVAQDSTNSFEVIVDDARYFYDGEGIIVGDEILIGTDGGGWQGPYEIKDADYDTNELTLDESVTVDSGDEIYLDDTGIDPDIGIYLKSDTGSESGEGDGDTCVPNCIGRECGDNGCGGSCGTCSDGYVCKGYRCIEGGTYRLYSTDLNSDGKVDMFDLTILLRNWRLAEGTRDEAADVNDDGEVNMIDIAILKSQWTKKY